MEVTHSVERSPIKVNWSHSHHKNYRFSTVWSHTYCKTTDSAQFEAIHTIKTKDSAQFEAIHTIKTTDSAQFEAIHTVKLQVQQNLKPKTIMFIPVLYLTTSKCVIEDSLIPTTLVGYLVINTSAYGLAMISYSGGFDYNLMDIIKLYTNRPSINGLIFNFSFECDGQDMIT